MNPITIAVVLSALLLLGSAVLMFVHAQGRERSEQSLQRLREGQDQVPLLALDTPELKLPMVGGLTRLLWRSGIDARPRAVIQALTASLVLAVLVLILAPPVAAFMIIGGLAAAVYGVLLQLAARRRARIVEQLPVFLENVIRVMSAGNNMEEALDSSARESPDPLRPLFASVGRQAKLGAPLDAVLAEAGELYRLRDLKILAMATTINRRYGGSMRGILRSLILVIRQRGMAARELRALTAETRFSALVLAVLPMGFAVFFFLRNPQYYINMYHDHTGAIVLWSAALLQVAGALVLWRMLGAIGETDE
jgi:tight adherence protein B